MEKSFAVGAEYLVLPIRNEGDYVAEDRSGRLKLDLLSLSRSLNGSELDYGVSLASGPDYYDDVDWYAFFSLARFRGKEARGVRLQRHRQRGFESGWCGRPTPFPAPRASTGNPCGRGSTSPRAPAG